MNTLTTAQAATAAGVTAETIRHWARMGAVRATKTACRWAIDAASLLHRIALGRETAAARTARTKKEKKTVQFTVENMVAIGGNEWKRGDYHRVYLNDWHEFIGLEVSRYKTGNISSASLGGYGISNSEARRILAGIHKVYFDAAAGKVHAQGLSYDGREFDDGKELAQAVFAGIRKAVASI